MTHTYTSYNKKVLVSIKELLAFSIDFDEGQRARSRSQQRIRQPEGPTGAMLDIRCLPFVASSVNEFSFVDFPPSTSYSSSSVLRHRPPADAMCHPHKHQRKKVIELIQQQESCPSHRQRLKTNARQATFA
jgi:hypothetical protein